MDAITGITGKVGAALARALLADRRPAHAVIRDIKKGYMTFLQEGVEGGQKIQVHLS